MKKIISTLLTLIIILGFSTIGFSAEDAQITSDGGFSGVIIVRSELGQLEDLGVMKDIGLGACQNITRAELAKVITQLMAMPEPEVLCKYKDVSAHNPYSGSINYVTGQGIMSGYNKELFLPDKNVTYYEFIKTIIILLGYGEMAEQKGGDPHGYMTVANDFGLVIFPSGSDRILTKEEVAKILLKAIDVPLLEKNTQGEQDIYKISEKTIKSKYLIPESTAKSSVEDKNVEDVVTSAGELHMNKINSANALIKLGILKGDEDGSLRLADAITRAEAATLILRANAAYSDILNVYTPQTLFDDTINHWAVKEISFAYENGIVDGVGENKFEPERKVTIQEFSKMLVTLLGYKYEAENEGSYPHGYMLTAHRLGIFKGLYLDGADDATREQVAVMLANALDIPLMVQSGFGAAEEFKIMDGKDGTLFKTLKMSFENN